jgi:hypothetical protein
VDREEEGAVESLIQRLIDWLNALPFQASVRYTEWVVPAAQTVHILAVSLVITGALVLALRGLGLAGREWGLARWHVRLRRSTLLSLWLLLVTGAVLVLAEPERALPNGLFRIKLLLVLVTLLLAHGLGRALAREAPGHQAGVGARLLALVVLAGWVAVAIAGRWIAYAG